MVCDMNMNQWRLCILSHKVYGSLVFGIRIDAEVLGRYLNGIDLRIFVGWVILVYKKYIFVHSFD